MQHSVRLPAVAGRFYPAAADALTRELDSLLTTNDTQISARAVIVPHAGYIYSGSIAGATFARVQIPTYAVVLCPNHTGMGDRRAVYANGAWRLPIGDVSIHSKLATAICKYARLVEDTLAHEYEHAAEVELPFLVARKSDVSVVPICLGHLSVAECESIGLGIAEAIRSLGIEEQVLLVASTDMSHYISASDAKKLDELAIERIEALDARGLYDVVTSQNISMCGFIPTTVSLFAALALGVKSAKLVRYGNSGERSGDFESVVGYAGFILS